MTHGPHPVPGSRTATALAGGGSSGLVAGACCMLSSIAATSAYVYWRALTTLPDNPFALAATTAAVGVASLSTSVLVYRRLWRRRPTRERSSEEAQRTPNALLREMSDALPCGVFHLHVPDGDADPQFLFVGRPMERIVGVSVAEHLADWRALWRHVCSDDATRAQTAFMQALAASTSIALDFKVDWGCGMRWVHLEATVFAVTGGTRWTGYAMDVTEQRTSSLRIAEQLDFQQRLIDTIPNLIFIKDAEARYVSVNRAYENAYGLLRQDLAGKTVLTPGVVDDAARARAIHEEHLRIIKTGTTYSYQRESRWADGKQHHELYWGSSISRADGSSAGLVGAVVDISERVQAEEMLREREEQLRRILESAPIAVVVTTLVGRAIFHNKHVLDMFRVSDEEFREHGLKSRYVRPDDREELFQMLMQNGSVNDIEIEYIRGDGSRMWVHVSSRMDVLQSEEVAFGWLEDVTARKQAADTLRQAKETAEAATAAKSAFLANMSHEIRTPMNAIIGLAHLALQTDLNAHQRDYVQKVHGAGQSLLGIINDVLDFSKIEAGKLAFESIDFNLDTLLSRVATLAGGKAIERDLALVFEVAPDVPRDLCSDPLRLGQVLTNLINNAIKFTERGRVVVQVSHRAIEPDGIELQVAVRDTGIGMTPAERARLFQPFCQADESTTRRYGGTGLGLSICKRLVDLAQGTIAVDSIQGEGSVFSFTWPCAPATGAQAPRRILLMQLRGMRVMVVDDNEAARTILNDVLQRFGFEVELVASAAEAIAALNASQLNPTRPYGLVFTDWKMPSMDGLELARHIKSADNPAPPVVLVTAFEQGEARSQPASMYVDAFLPKPVDQSLLVNTLMGLFADEARSGVARLGSALSGSRLDGLRVLLTEDNEINQQIAVELLQAAGASVEVACDGRACLDKLEAAAPGTFHLVLMDLQMPVMDGHQATLAIREDARHRNLPIIAMTAHAMVEERQRCLDEGMDDHISKPVDPEVLYATLRKWGARHIAAVAPAAPVAPVASTAQGVAEPPVGPARGDAMDKLQAALPMLDLRAALRRVAGNHKLYAELLQRFHDDQISIAEQLRSWIDQGDLPTAQRAAHTLKGVAGNIGAGKVALAAAHLEDALRESLPVQRTLDLTETLQQELTPLLGALALWLCSTRADRSAAAAGLAPAPAVSVDALRASLLHFCDLLDAMDGDVQDMVDALCARASTHIDQDLLARVARHVRDFDFDEAAALLRGHPLLQVHGDPAPAHQPVAAEAASAAFVP